MVANDSKVDNIAALNQVYAMHIMHVTMYYYNSKDMKGKERTEKHVIGD